MLCYKDTSPQDLYTMNLHVAQIYFMKLHLLPSIGPGGGADYVHQIGLFPLFENAQPSLRDLCT
jgi:hypothetical protein